MQRHGQSPDGSDAAAIEPDSWASKSTVPRYHRMSADLLTDDPYVEKLLAVAAVWRARAGGITDPYHGDVMRRAAEELERAAARAKTQAPTVP
jgi:hypothetical protein